MVNLEKSDIYVVHHYSRVLLPTNLQDLPGISGVTLQKCPPPSTEMGQKSKFIKIMFPQCVCIVKYVLCLKFKWGTCVIIKH